MPRTAERGSAQTATPSAPLSHSAHAPSAAAVRTSTSSVPTPPQSPAPVPARPPLARRWAASHRRRLVAMDAAAIIAAVAVSYLLRFPAAGLGLDTALGARYALVGVIITTIWLSALALFGTRRPAIAGDTAAEFARVTAASMAAFGLLAVLSLGFLPDIARGYLLLALGGGLALVLTGRGLAQARLRRARRNGQCRDRALLIGHPDDVAEVRARFDAEERYRTVGTASTESTGELPNRNVHCPQDIAAWAGELHADTVILASPPADGQELRRLAWALEGTAAEIALASPLNDIADERLRVEPGDGAALLVVELPRFEGGRHHVKRAFDIVASALSLLIAGPIIGVLALLVRLTSPGPAFFRQTRVGRDGTTFTMIKLRTMVVTAERDLDALRAQSEGAGPLFKMKNDPRVTRLGAVLRRFSLDELPQIWNVLRGDMSLVGPRPPLPREVADYDAPARRRLLITPGLTGLWQVGGRSELSWEESIRLDLYYVENWSLRGDLAIILRTLGVLIRPSGAY